MSVRPLKPGTGADSPSRLNLSITTAWQTPGGAAGRRWPIAAYLIPAAVAPALLFFFLWHGHRALSSYRMHSQQGSQPRDGVDMRLPTIIAFGDSITQNGFEPGGWTAILANKYIRKADVINRGLSGYNTRWALHALDSLAPLAAAPSLFVTVMLGANDAALATGFSARQHVPLDEFSRNLREIVVRLQRMGFARVVVLSPPPVNDDARLERSRTVYKNPKPVLDRSNTVTGTYAEAAQQVANSTDCVFVDMWNELQREPDWRRSVHNGDGLHLGEKGNARLAAALLHALQQQLPECMPEQLPMLLPLWDQVDADDPATSFAQYRAARTRAQGGTAATAAQDM